MRRVVKRWLLHLREDGVSWSVFVFQLYIRLLDGIFILWIRTFVSLTTGRSLRLLQDGGAYRTLITFATGRCA